MAEKPSSTKAKRNEPMASEEPPTNKKAESKNMASDSWKIYTVELYFDDELHSKILSPINFFNDRKITTTYHKQGWKPCIFLLLDEHVDPQDFRDVIENLASIHEAFPISFFRSSLLVSQKKRNFYSLHLAPAPSMPLVMLHKDFCQMVKEKCAVDFQDSWVPLCPIGFNVPDTKLVEALDSVFQANFLYQGYVTSIGLAELSSNKRTPLFSFNLKESSEGRSPTGRSTGESSITGA